MQANPKPQEPGEEEIIERAILALAMAVYPMYRTIPELGDEFGSPAPVKRAVASLVSYGLIVLHGNTLLPTAAAYHCHRLDAW
jgi:superfamily II helicase